MNDLLERIWYGTSFLKFLLIPISWVYRLVIYLRRNAYAYGFFKSDEIKVPVIVVGNLTVGGTGKTPLIILLAQWLTEQGYFPGIITRGYGGSNNYHPIYVTPESDPAKVGDEPVLIAARTQRPVVVARHRVDAANYLLQQTRCNIILSDDGLQHYALKRDLEIAVVDGQRRFGNKHCLPAGPLRETLDRLRDIKFIIANGKPQHHEVAMQLHTQGLVQLSSDKFFDVSHLHNQTIHAVAGIGNPQRFFDMLAGYYENIIPHKFNDHHHYQASDFNFSTNAAIVMTEKDAIKCRNFASDQMYFLKVNAEISDEGFQKEFLEEVKVIYQNKHHNNS